MGSRIENSWWKDDTEALRLELEKNPEKITEFDSKTIEELKNRRHFSLFHIKNIIDNSFLESATSGNSLRNSRDPEFPKVILLRRLLKGLCISSNQTNGQGIERRESLLTINQLPPNNQQSESNKSGCCCFGKNATVDIKGNHF